MTDDELLAQPIIVIGAPRSGTTLLAGLLSRHPALCLLNEPRITWKYGNERKSDVLSRCDARPEVNAHIRREFAHAIRAAGKTRMLEKSPSNAVRMGFVDNVFPDCKVVHIMRHGVQSALSIRAFWQKHASGAPRRHLVRRAKEIKLRQVPHYSKELARRVLAPWMPRVVKAPLWGVRLPGMHEMLRDLDLLEVCSLQWRWCVEAACQEGRKWPADRYMECRLEEFDQSVLERILQFCHLEPSAEVLSAYQERFDPSQPQGRTSSANPGEVALIRRWIEPTLAWLEME
jgi:hypothetical protein